MRKKSGADQRGIHPALRRERVEELLSVGLQSNEISEYFFREGSVAMLLKPAPRSVHCDQCDEKLTYRTARRLGRVDLCETCRAGLFADHERASALYPELF